MAYCSGFIGIWIWTWTCPSQVCPLCFQMAPCGWLPWSLQLKLVKEAGVFWLCCVMVWLSVSMDGGLVVLESLVMRFLTVGDPSSRRLSILGYYAGHLWIRWIRWIRWKFSKLLHVRSGFGVFFFWRPDIWIFFFFFFSCFGFSSSSDGLKISMSCFNSEWFVDYFWSGSGQVHPESKERERK